MHLSATLLKILTTTATLAATGGAGALVVVNDPKPQAAPLHPPVSGAPSKALAPLPPSCGNTVGRSNVTLTDQQTQELQQLRTTAKKDRRALLATFPAQDRLQILAYQASRRKPTPAAANAACRQASSAAPITASTVAGTDTGTPVISYVS